MRAFLPAAFKIAVLVPFVAFRLLPEFVDLRRSEVEHVFVFGTID
jgi:hypothetical protein